MNVMTHRLVLFVLGAAFSGTVLAAAGSMKQANQLLDRHHYESAASLLRAGVNGGDAMSVAFLLGRAYLDNARLHRAFSSSALGNGNRYLKQLSTQRGRDRSRYAMLYYGEYLIESGNRKAGLVQLQKFLAQGGIGKRYRQIADVRLASARGGTLPASAGLDAEARTELAAALSQRAGKQAEAVTLLERALGELRKPGAGLPMRAVTNAIRVYTQAGQYDKALMLAGSEDLGRPSYQESPGKSKVLRFYDAALLSNLAELYQAAGEREMMRAQGDTRLKAIAGYFLAESWMTQGQSNKSGRTLMSLSGGEGLPPAYRERVPMLQAAIEAIDSKGRKGGPAFTALGSKHARDPVLLGEVLMACVQSRARCGAVAATAEKLAATGQGERFRGLHRAIGSLHAASGRHERALQYLETARDKSNKNRIDTNDPLLLVQLADLYLAIKSFSENLEIYFELSKEFPVVRQLQETGQGIYSMEFRSAGDVKIF